MRGLIVVAIGAILIWFGLSRGDSPVEAAADQAEAPAEAGRGEPSDDFGIDVPVVLAPRVEEAPVDVRAEERPEPSTGNDLPGGGEADQRVALAGAPPVGAMEVPGEAPLEASVVEPGPVLEAPERNASLQVQDADLSKAVDPTRLATFLLEAWMAQDPVDLSVYLKQGEGADLPAQKRQLVASFWQAVAGEPDRARTKLEELRGADGVTTGQVSLLAAALEVPGSRAVPRAASSGRVEPLSYSMRMVLLEGEAQQLLKDREYSRSAVAWSDLIQMEVAAPWEPHREALLSWGRSLEQAQSNHRFNVNGTWPSIDEKVLPGGSLIALRKRVVRRRSDLNLCTGLIAQVNGVSGYVHPGDVMRIPTDPVNVVVDLDARVLLYRHGDEVVRLWDVGIGKDGHETPVGVYEVGHKIEKPAHTTKGLPYGDPDNPLGSRWAGLRRPGTSKDTSYGIHGTSAPDGVGGAVSLGCVRMRNQDVNELFEILPRGTQVVIQP